MARTRNTLQKEIVFKTVHSMDNHPTAEMVYDIIITTYGNISKATVYRILNQLADQDKIMRVKIPNAADRFDFHKEPHYHIRCVRCGEVMDAPLPVSDELTQKARETTDIEILGHHAIFDGICKQCSR